MNDKKVLIVGNSLPFVRRMLEYTKNIVVAPGDPEIAKLVECVDIREYSVIELLEYVVENDIMLTIVVSDIAIKSDITSLFVENDRLIFSPSAKSADFVLNKSQGKRFLYKLHAQTPKFGIFEKQQLAFDYLKDTKYPLVISSDSHDSVKYFCTTPERARFHIEDLFLSGEQKVVIEDYVYGHEFTLYFISDGYHALPLASVKNFKFTENGDGGILTSGVGAYVPDDKLSSDLINKILNEIVLRGLNYLQNSGKPYCGIIGVEGVLSGDECFILNFKPFMYDFEIQAVLNSVDENLLELFDACANGFFADEYDDILTNDNISVSCVLRKRSKIFNSVDLSLVSSDYFINGDRLILTSNAKTLSRAKMTMAEDIDVVGVTGLKLRTDIFKS